MIKIDLHTHSIASTDGGLVANDYAQTIKNKSLDIIAITDHNQIDFAINFQTKYPKNIIVGEEIMTIDGEIIGLFLTKKIAPNLSLSQTIANIHAQAGLCYVPHPLEKLRSGLNWDQLNKIKSTIDILEIGNGRALNKQNYKELVNWALANNIQTASSSDAHGYKGLGRSYTEVSSMPTDAKSLLVALGSSSKIITYPSLVELLYPKYNKIRNRLCLKI